MDLYFGVVVLGSGASSRMGQPKLLLPWGGTTVIAHLVAQWHQLEAEQVAVVTALHDQALNAELDRLGVPKENRIMNPNPALGMFSSIQCAARWAGWRSGLSHWAITLGDQPHLKRATLRTLLDFAAANPDKICQPVWKGRRRHPVVLPAGAFAQIGNSTVPDLKAFLDTRSPDRAFCEINDPGLELDIDLPSDYERAIALFPPET